MSAHLLTSDSHTFSETREVAKSVGVPLIPLHEVSASYVEHIGPEASWRLNNNDYSQWGVCDLMPRGRGLTLVPSLALQLISAHQERRSLGESETGVDIST